MKKIEGSDLFLSYDGKMGIDLLVSPAISYAKKLVPEKAGWVEQMSGNIVKLRLGDIDKLQKVFEKLKLDNILLKFPTPIKQGFCRCDSVQSPVNRGL